MKKLTIITINFNHLEGLKRTIDSIVNQTFTDYEWIVVDGGSTDGSWQLFEQYQDRFAWWCSEQDKGVYNAMNKGLQHATGEYVNFMNSGDVFATPTTLADIFSKPHDADILYGIMTRGTIKGEYNNKLLLKSHINWWDFYVCTFNHQATFTRKILFERYGGYDESYKALADWRHFAELICVQRVSYEYLPVVIAVYEGSGLSDDERVFPEEIQRIRREVYPTIRPGDYYELQYLGICNRYWLPRQLYRILTRGLERVLHVFNIE